MRNSKHLKIRRVQSKVLLGAFELGLGSAHFLAGLVELFQVGPSTEQFFFKQLAGNTFVVCLANRRL